MRRILFVGVPRVWRALGAVFTVVYVIAFGGAIHCLLQPHGLGDAETQVLCTLHVLLAPVVLPLLVPCFIQRYPPWVIRIYGEPFLRKLIAALH